MVAHFWLLDFKYEKIEDKEHQKSFSSPFFEYLLLELFVCGKNFLIIESTNKFNEAFPEFEFESREKIL